MNLMIVLGGLLLMAALALLVGVVDTHARDRAWRRIAEARRAQQEQALRRCLHSARCDYCPLDRYFGGG